MQRQTTIANAKTVTRKWYVIDATNLPLGRLASEIARHLTGKNKPIYTPKISVVALSHSLAFASL